MPAVYSSKEQNFLEHQFGNVSIVATLMSAVYSTATPMSAVYSATTLTSAVPNATMTSVVPNGAPCKKQRRRYGNCNGCRATKCGVCNFCSKPSLKKPCVNRKCTSLV
ncbi:uncharacterized protein [Dysidea avara]|uniref:uncharacterized protein isoform X3 n=1 Tax=Dysidea avara TaxID=196820 RepID=UPI0033286B70